MSSNTPRKAPPLPSTPRPKNSNHLSSSLPPTPNETPRTSNNIQNTGNYTKPGLPLSGDVNQTTNTTNFVWQFHSTTQNHNRIDADTSYVSHDAQRSQRRGGENYETMWYTQIGHPKVSFQSIASVFCCLTITVPLLVAIAFVVLRNTLYITQKSYYTNASWIGIVTPILFGLISLSMTIPYTCLYAFWIRSTAVRLLFWLIHIFSVALPISLLLPLRTGYLTNTSQEQNIWTTHLLLIASFGGILIVWILILHASELSLRSLTFRMIETVIFVGCITIPTLLLIATHADPEFGTLLLGDFGPNRSSTIPVSSSSSVSSNSNSNTDPNFNIQHGSGVLFSTLLCGLVISTWLSVASRWFLQTSVSIWVVMVMSIDVICVIAPLGGTAIASLVFLQLGESMGISTQGWFGLLALEGVLLLGAGLLSRLQLFEEDTSNVTVSMLLISELCYICLFAIPVPLLLPFDVLHDFQNSSIYNPLGVIVLVGSFVFLWSLGVYIDVTNIRHSLFDEIEDMKYLEMEIEQEEKEKEEEKKKDNQFTPDPVYRTPSLVPLHLSTHPLPNTSSRLSLHLSGHEEDTSLQHANNSSAYTEIQLQQFARSRQRKKVLQNPAQFVHQGIVGYLKTAWMLPTLIYITLVLPSVPTMFVMLSSPTFSASFYPHEHATWVIFNTMAFAGIVSILWLGWHGPLQQMHSNFATYAHTCRPVPTVENSRMEILKCGLFIGLIFIPSVILVPLRKDYVARIVCLPIVVIGFCLLSYLEIGWSRTLHFWSDHEERIILSVIWLGMVMIPSAILLPDGVEHLVQYVIDITPIDTSDPQCPANTCGTRNPNSCEDWFDNFIGIEQCAERCSQQFKDYGTEQFCSDSSKRSSPTTPSSFYSPSPSSSSSATSMSMTAPYLTTEAALVLGVVLILGLLWIPYVFFHHAYRRGSIMWYQIVQGTLYITGSFGVALLLLTSAIEETIQPLQTTNITNITTTIHTHAVVVYYNHIAGNTITIFMSAMLTIWIWYVHRILLPEKKFSFVDIIILSIFIIVCLIIPLSLCPTVYIDAVARGVFLSDTVIISWREAIGILLVLGASTVVWIQISIVFEFNERFKSWQKRLCVAIIFVGFTAIPSATAVAVVPMKDLTACGVLLLLEILGPSIYLIAWIDEVWIRNTNTLKDMSARIGIAALLLCGVAVPFVLIINALVFPDPWNGALTVRIGPDFTNRNITNSSGSSGSKSTIVALDPTAVVTPITIYLFLLGISSFILIYLKNHESTLQKHKTPFASTLLCFTSVVVAIIVFGYLCAAKGPNSEISSVQYLATLLLIGVPFFVLGGILFSHAHVRLIDKFAVASLLFAVLPVLALLQNVGKSLLATFLVVAIPLMGTFWMCLATCRSQEGHDATRSSLLWLFNGMCYIIVVPLGILLPLLLSTPNTILSAPIYNVMLILAFLFPGVYFVGVVALQLKKWEDRCEHSNQQLLNRTEENIRQTSCFQSCCNIGSMFVQTIKNPETGFWISHIGLVLFTLCTEVVLVKVALPSQQWTLWFLLLLAPTVHVLGMNATPTFESNTDALTKSNVQCVLVSGIIFPFLVGTVMLSIRNLINPLPRPSFISLGVAVLTVLPFLSISWLFLWAVRDAVRSLPGKKARLSVSATTAACCCTVLLPVGILAFILMTDWYSNLAGATTLLVTISILAILCLIDVAAGTMAVNATFNSIRKERLAKETTVAVVQVLERMQTSINTDVARMIFDKIGELPISGMRSGLNASGEQKLITTLLEEDGEMILTTLDFVEGIETGRIILCTRCEIDRSRNVRAAKKNILCQACILDDKILARRKELEAKKLADEGDRRMQEELRHERLKKKKELQEQRKKEKESKIQAEKCMNDNQWKEAMSNYDIAIDCNPEEAKYFYQRGLCHLQLAAEERKRKKKMKHFSAALMDGERCHHLREHWKASFILRGGALVGLERFNDALDVYESGLVESPECIGLINGVSNTQRVARGVRADTSIHSSKNHQEIATLPDAPNLGSFLKSFWTGMTAGFIIQSAPLRNLVEKNIENLRLTPVDDIAVTRTNRNATTSMSSTISNRHKRMRRRRKSQIMTLKEQHQKEIGVAHRNSNVVFRIQIVDAVLRTDLHMQRGIKQPPRIFVRISLLMQDGTTRRKDTHPIREISPSWRDQYFLVRKWMAPPRGSLNVQLLENDGDGRIVELGNVQIFMYQVTRYCREKAYVHFDIEDKSKLQTNRKKTKVSEPYQIGLSFGHADQQAALHIIQATSNRNDVLLRRVFSEWTSVAFNDGERRKKIVDELFSYYSNILELERKDKKKARRVSQAAMRQLSFRSELKRIRDKGKADVASVTATTDAASIFRAGAPNKKIENTKVRELHKVRPIQRFNSEKIAVTTLCLSGFSRMCQDCMLDDLNPKMIFNKKARAAIKKRKKQHGRRIQQMGIVDRFVLDRNDFQECAIEIARKKYPKLPIQMALQDLVDMHVVRFAPPFVKRKEQRHNILRQYQHDESLMPLDLKTEYKDVRAAAINRYRRNHAATLISKWWRHRRLRKEAALVLTRWGKRAVAMLADLPIRRLNQELKALIAGSLDVDEDLLYRKRMRETANKESIHQELERPPTCFERLVMFGSKRNKTDHVFASDDGGKEDEDDAKKYDDDDLSSNNSFKITHALSSESKAVTLFEQAANRKAKSFRSKHRKWETISNKMLAVLKENAQAESIPTHDSDGKRKDVAVDWTLMDNRTTMFAVVLSTMWQYSSVALTNGPLSYVDQSTLNSSIAVAKTWRDEMFERNNTKWVPYAVDLVANIPKFQLPAYYGDTYIYFFFIAMSIALIYPVLAYHGVMRVRSNTFGLNKKGNPIATCSAGGLLELGLSVANDFLYFGVMTTLMSAFACQYNPINTMESTTSTTSMMTTINITNVSISNISISNSTWYTANQTNTSFYTAINNHTHTAPLFSLVVSKTTKCFDINAPNQLFLMFFGGISLLAFYPLATLLSPNFQFQNKGLDIKYEQWFLILENQADLLLAGSEVFLSDNISTDLVLVLQMFLCLGMGCVNHYLEPCLVIRLNVIKTVVYLLCAWTAFSVLVFRATPTREAYIVVTSMISTGWITFPALGYRHYRNMQHNLSIPILEIRNKEKLGYCWCCSACAENHCSECTAFKHCVIGICCKKNKKKKNKRLTEAAMLALDIEKAIRKKSKKMVANENVSTTPTTLDEPTQRKLTFKKDTTRMGAKSTTSKGKKKNKVLHHVLSEAPKALSFRQTGGAEKKNHFQLG